ncbi:hypothetical protein NL676_028862 [Syzygium grande]|nr:hypothetical protein NL676_028862 [Syzygium grande]
MDEVMSSSLPSEQRVRAPVRILEDAKVRDRHGGHQSGGGVPSVRNAKDIKSRLKYCWFCCIPSKPYWQSRHIPIGSSSFGKNFELESRESSTNPSASKCENQNAKMMHEEMMPSKNN